MLLGWHRPRSHLEDLDDRRPLSSRDKDRLAAGSEQTRHRGFRQLGAIQDLLTPRARHVSGGEQRLSLLERSRRAELGLQLRIQLRWKGDLPNPNGHSLAEGVRVGPDERKHLGVGWIRGTAARRHQFLDKQELVKPPSCEQMLRTAVDLVSQGLLNKELSIDEIAHDPRSSRWVVADREAARPRLLVHFRGRDLFSIGNSNDLTFSFRVVASGGSQRDRSGAADEEVPSDNMPEIASPRAGDRVS
jgi:hypothetical protein